MPNSPANPADSVSQVLQAISSRLVWARLLPVAVSILALGMVAAGLVVAMRGPAALSLLPAIGMLTLAALAIGILLAVWRRGSLAATARRVDFSLHLSEQLSTALDRSTAASNPVLRALRQGAQRAAATIRIDRAVPIDTKFLRLALVGLLLATAGAATAYGLRATPIWITEEEAAPLEQPAERQAYSADDIEVLADLLANDAERRNSDYLDALAKAVKKLAESARQDMPQAELQAQLDALLDHAAAGYEGQLPSWMADKAADAGSVLQNAVNYSKARQQAAEERQRLANSNQPRISSADMYTLSDDRLSRSALPATPGNGQPMTGDVSDREGELASASPSGGDFSATPMQDEAFERAGSLPIGAAAQSGKGESNIAGGGSQTLLADTDFLETMADPTQSMAITDQDLGEGSRIRIHMPTDAEMSDAGAFADSGGAWSRQVAQSVSRQLVPPEASAVVSRYFNRTDEGQQF